MNANSKSQSNWHRTIQGVLLLGSLIAFAGIAFGYYNLLVGFGWFIALVLAIIIASFAWLLARAAGTGPGGIKGNIPFMALLFLISAAGIYNTMIVVFEGKQILADTASDAQADFGSLETVANRELAASGAAERINKINSSRDALVSEIKNPQNCGQGPEARRLIGELQRELPEFEPLSGARDCSKNDAVIADYNERIDALISRAQWNNAELNAVSNGAAKAREDIGKLRREISRSYSADDISQISSIFEDHQTEYQNLLQRLEQETNTEDLPEGLDIVAAQSLGNIYKLPALFLNRLDEASTYFYLLIALGIDVAWAFLFQSAASSRVRKSAIASPISGAW